MTTRAAATRVDPRQGPCPECGRPMVSQRAYSKDRAGWRARGFVEKKANDRCQACYMRGYCNAKKPQPLDDATIARLRAEIGIEVTNA